MDKRERENQKESGTPPVTEERPPNLLSDTFFLKDSKRPCVTLSPPFFLARCSTKHKSTWQQQHTSRRSEATTPTHPHTHTRTFRLARSVPFSSDIDHIQRTFQSSNNCSANGTWDSLQQRRERRESNRIEIRPSRKDPCFVEERRLHVCLWTKNKTKQECY
jgi:hypothetical protein